MARANTREECLGEFWAIIAEAEAHLAVDAAQNQRGTNRKSLLDTTTTPEIKASNAARW